MTHLVFSGYQVLEGSERPKFLDNTLESQKAWAADNGYEYLDVSADLLDHFSEEIKDIRFAGVTRNAASVADVSRILYAKELLMSGYESVAWLDADLLLRKNFTLPTKEYAAPYVNQEIYMTFIANRDKPTHVGNSRSTGIMKFFPQHIPFIDLYLNLCKDISLRQMDTNIHPNIKPLPLTWKHYGTTMFASLNHLYNFPVAQGLGFANRSSLQNIADHEDSFDKFHEFYNRAWAVYGSEINCYNLDDSRPENLQLFIDKCIDAGYIYGVDA